MASCIHAIDRRMSSNRLKLNADKTVHRTRLQAAAFKVKMWQYTARWPEYTISAESYSCLGVILDTELSMVQHVRGVTSRYFYRLRQTRAIRISLTAETSKLHAFINSIIESLDYCKSESVLYGAGAVHLRKLQSVQNGLHGLSRENENMTQPPQHFETICTGCLWNHESVSGSACLCIRVFMGLLRYISPRCVSNAHLTLNTTNFDLMFVVNWLYL